MPGGRCVIQFDKTQPVEIRPRYDFGGGVIFKRVSATCYKPINAFGEDTGPMVRAELVVYEPTLEAQRRKQQGTP